MEGRIKHGQGRRPEDDMCMMVLDVRKAHLCAPAARDVFVELPKEEGEGAEWCGKLEFSMYGTRDAARNWAAEVERTMGELGFTTGTHNPCLFHHQTRRIRTFVHGDDYVSKAMPEQLRWMQRKFDEKY